MSKIAWIGTGVMGKSMVAHLQNDQDTITVYNRTASKAEQCKQWGMKVASTVEEAVQDADFIFTIVGFPRDVKEVYAKIFATAKPNAIAIDMTTSCPYLAKELYQQGQAKQIHVVDAPVSGGDSGARKATLSIMVGADQADYELLLPYFNKMGKNVLLMGGPGAGQHTKMANQIAIAGTIAGVTEAISYAKDNQLNPQLLLDAIDKGAAGSWQMENNAPKMVSEDFEPGFFIKHFVKDMKLARDSAAVAKLDLPVLNAVLAIYEKMIEEGDGDLGTQALIKAYQK